MKKIFSLIIFLLLISTPFGLKAQYSYITSDIGINIYKNPIFYPDYLFFQSANSGRPFLVENIQTKNNNFGLIFRQNIFKSFFLETGLSYQKTHIDFKSPRLYGDTTFNINIHKISSKINLGYYFLNYKKIKLYLSAGIDFNYILKYKETESLRYITGYSDDPMGGGTTANYATDITDIENEFVNIIYSPQKIEYHYTAEIGTLLTFWRLTICPGFKFHYVTDAIIINQDSYHYFTIHIRFGLAFFHERNKLYIDK